MGHSACQDAGLHHHYLFLVADIPWQKSGLTEECSSFFAVRARCMLSRPCLMLVRGRYPALLSPAEGTMQLFMWQPNIVGVANHVIDSSLTSLGQCLMASC